MLTKKIGSEVQLNPDCDLLDNDCFKFGYTELLFQELGVKKVEGIEPIRGNDPWYITGNLHGQVVSATFNTFENLTLSVFGERVSYNESMKNTLNRFIGKYRKGWYGHHQDRGKNQNNI